MNKINKLGAALFVFATTMAVTAGIASAGAPADPTGGGTTDLTDGITSWVEAYGVPMLVTLLILGTVIGVFLKFGRKAKNTVG